MSLLERKKLSLAVFATVLTCALVESPGWSQQPVRFGSDPAVLEDYRHEIDGSSLPAADLLFMDFQILQLQQPAAAYDRLKEYGVPEEIVTDYLQFAAQATTRVRDFQRNVVTENCAMLERLENDPAYAIERFVLIDAGAAALKIEIFEEMTAEFGEMTMEAVARRIESLRETSSSEVVNWAAYLRDSRIDSMAVVRAMCSRERAVN